MLAGNLGVATYGQLEIAKTRKDIGICSITFLGNFVDTIYYNVNELVYIYSCHHIIPDARQIKYHLACIISRFILIIWIFCRKVLSIILINIQWHIYKFSIIYASIPIFQTEQLVFPYHVFAY